MYLYISFVHMNEKDPTVERNVLGTQFLDREVECLGRLRGVRFKSRFSIRALEKSFEKCVCNSRSILVNQSHNHFRDMPRNDIGK